MSQFHEHVPARDLALVLGGGGAAGNAWEIGIIAGLADAGLDLTKAADQVIGTSAGATTAAQVRSGRSAADLFASVLSPPRPPAGGPPQERPPSLPMAAVFERMRAIGAAATSAIELQRAMGAFGLESDAVLGPGAEQRRAIVAARLPHPHWPDRPMLVVTIDAHTGEVAAFDRGSGVDLVDAVTASTSLPGLTPTVRINGRRYIDGGVRSTDNADLAVGYANVVVLSPLGGRSTAPEDRVAGQFEGLRRSPDWGTDLPSQVEALRKHGSNVVVITPDADSLAAMGTNQLNPATRPPSARAGFAQGKAEVARLKWLRRRSGVRARCLSERAALVNRREILETGPQAGDRLVDLQVGEAVLLPGAIQLVGEVEDRPLAEGAQASLEPGRATGLESGDQGPERAQLVAGGSDPGRLRSSGFPG